MDYAASRLTIYRRYKRMLHALNILLENRVIPKKEYAVRRRKIDFLYQKLKEDRIRNRPLGIRACGRPRLQEGRDEQKICKRPGCEKPAAEGQCYCSRECAPYGYYNLAPRELVLWK